MKNFKNILNKIKSKIPAGSSSNSNVELATGISTTLFGAFLMYKFMYRVEPGYLAIKFNLISGVGNKVYKEGYHLLTPFIEKPIIYDCRMNTHLHNVLCGTKDLQTVTIKVRLIARPMLDKLPELYRLLGKDYDTRVMTNIAYEICGVATSQFNATQIISQRDMISYIIKQRMTEKAKEFFIDVDDVALIDIKFSPEFSQAIEKKQVAQQDAERIKFLVDQTLEEKKSTIIRALGETEAVRKFGEANQTSDAYLTLRRLETAKKISKMISNSNNKIMLDSNSYFLNLPITPDAVKKI